REAKRSELSTEQQEIAWVNRLSPEEWKRFQRLRQSDVQPQRISEAANKAVQFSLDHHLERKSVASDKEILATAIKSTIGEATPEQVRHAFASNDNILRAEEDLCQFITTKEALAEEKRLIQYAGQSKNIYRPINEYYEPGNPLLNGQQKAAVK